MKIKILILLFIFKTMIYAGNAAYQDVSPKTLVQDADIIISGEIVKILSSNPDVTAMDTGIIAIDKILKGAKNTSFIRIIYPGKNRTGISPMDITFKSGDKGLWMLKSYKNNCFRVYHPDCFQKKDAELIIKDIINKKSLNKIKQYNPEDKLIISKLYRHEGTEETLPFLIDMLKEKNEQIFSNGRLGIYRITNQIFIDKDTLSLKEKNEFIKLCRSWWEKNSNLPREQWIKNGIIRDIQLLKVKDETISKRAAVRLIDYTGQYGFTGSGFAPQTEAAIGKWDRWWEKNANRHQEDWAEDLITSEDPYHRHYGIIITTELIKFGNKNIINNLIKCLMDPYPQIQEDAIESLYILTGENFGFDSRKTAEKNMESIKQWMNWRERIKKKKDL
ncbi:hypothetical protein HY745_07400 [Candidatus Desantisbacteria bacterium]|nr:hypothetical protein [Candidatus Desantisbacteria bacterium]